MKWFSISDFRLANPHSEWREGVAHSPCARLSHSELANAPAFTILELLVAMAILALLLVLLLQLTNHTLQASKTSTQQLDSTQAARQILDVLSTDLASAVTTDGATVLTQASNGAPSLVFLTFSRGPVANTRFLSVNYQLKNNEITRAYRGIGWNAIGPGSGNPANFLAAAETAATSPDATSVLARGVLQFSALAVLEDGSMVSLLAPPGNAAGASGTMLFEGQTVPAGWTALVPSRTPLPPTLGPTTARVRALLVAIASVDEQNLRLLNPMPAFTQPASTDPVAAWETELASTPLPGPARSAIRFHSKVIPLP